MEAIALHDFVATETDELSFQRGEVLNIISMQEDPNWYRAQLRRQSGLVPCNYIELRPHSWYIKSCSREDAELRLNEMSSRGNYLQPQGAFIVRESSANNHGGFSISVKDVNSVVVHFKVLQDEQNKFFIWVKKFDSLNELIEHHRRISISNNANALLLCDRVLSARFDRSNQQPPRRVIAHFDFDPTETDELAFKRGDIIQVIAEEDEHWCIGEVNGQQGLFPLAYVSAINADP